MIFLKRAIALAEKGDSRVFPNPRVGACIVKDDLVIGEGSHLVAGEAHAEVHAIADCGDQDLRGCTAYVSLEPCAHEGRTPSCAKMLIRKGISRVVFAVEDPGPGEGGAELMRQAGLEVLGPVDSAGAKEILEPFIKNVTKGETYFLLKWAMTLDGRIALGNGDSKWISGEASRKDVHHLRTICDGIMVGAGTVIKDQPNLDVRYDIKGPSPRPIVWDPKGRLAASDCWQKWSARNAIWIRPDGTTPVPETDLTTIDSGNNRALAKSLFAAGVHMVLVEGGAGLHGMMIDEDLADAIRVYIAPKLCGGNDSRSPVGGVGVPSMTRALACGPLKRSTCGEDIVLEGLLKRHH